MVNAGEKDQKQQAELAALGDDVSSLEAEITEVNRECNVYCDRSEYGTYETVKARFCP